MRGCKLSTLDALREIAKSVTCTDYPEVVVITDPLKPEYLNNKDLVIKRSYSDAGNHVWKRDDQRDPATMRKFMKDTQSMYNHDSLRDWGVNPVWFGLPYIPQLIDKGEIRCFFIGGVLTYMISTRPITDELAVKEARQITPLSHLS